jgi:hypothetical protein
MLIALIGDIGPVSDGLIERHAMLGCAAPLRTANTRTDRSEVLGSSKKPKFFSGVRRWPPQPIAISGKWISLLR